MAASIYKITNDINDKVYVGQTCNSIEKRFARHCAEARWKNTKQMPIILAIKKYGYEHFKIELLELLPENMSQKDVNDREIFWGDKLNTLSPNGYNLLLGGGTGRISEETKLKISQKNKGKKRTDETKKKLSDSHKGHKIKDETKKKLSDLNKGKVLSDEHKKKIGISNTGKIRNDKSKKLMRDKKLKYIYEILSPQGEIFKINNLRQLCLQYNLNNYHMHYVSEGTKSHYKQWRILSKVPIEKEIKK